MRCNSSYAYNQAFMNSQMTACPWWTMICLKCNQLQRDRSWDISSRAIRRRRDLAAAVGTRTPSTAVLSSSSGAGLDDHPITLPLTPSRSLVHLAFDPITRRRTRRGPPHYVISPYPSTPHHRYHPTFTTPIPPPFSESLCIIELVGCRF